MLTTLIWWSGIVIDAVIVVRGFQAKLLRKYSLFFCYMAFMFSVEILRVCCDKFAHGLYSRVYWNSEVIVILASYAVIAAIYTRALADYPGIARLGFNFLSLTLVVTLIIVGTGFWYSSVASWDSGTAVLGRDLRYVEGALLLALLWLLRHYHISMGRNLRGLTLGYAFMIATDIMSRGSLFLSHGNAFSVFLRKVLPITYLITLIIWCASLWKAHPEHVRPADPEIE